MAKGRERIAAKPAEEASRHALESTPPTAGDLRQLQMEDEFVIHTAELPKEGLMDVGVDGSRTITAAQQSRRRARREMPSQGKGPGMHNNISAIGEGPNQKVTGSEPSRGPPFKNFLAMPNRQGEERGVDSEQQDSSYGKISGTN